ncbi:MAG: hypothetical protein V3U85_00235 [Hyphomicrobium sp.]
MNQPVKEAAAGLVNGVNNVFSSSIDYKAGSVVGFRNGQAVPSQTTELGGRDFQLEITPKVGDVIAVHYIPIPS